MIEPVAARAEVTRPRWAHIVKDKTEAAYRRGDRKTARLDGDLGSIRWWLCRQHYSVTEFGLMATRLDRDAGEPISPSAASAGLEVWRLCESYAVVQAAMLIAGCDPGSVMEVEKLPSHEQPAGYAAAKNALLQQLDRDSWFGRIVELNEVYRYRNGSTYTEIDVEKSIVWSCGLKSWLSDSGVNSGFFFPARTSEPSAVPDYLNPAHPRYAPKLAAAVRAWQAYGDVSTKFDGKSPKQVLAEWLKQNAAPFGLADQEGKLNNEGIQDVAKVANWQTKGGAPRTPGKPGQAPAPNQQDGST